MPKTEQCSTYIQVAPFHFSRGSKGKCDVQEGETASRQELHEHTKSTEAIKYLFTCYSLDTCPLAIIIDQRVQRTTRYTSANTESQMLSPEPT